jgi:hypothetical protein
MGSIVIGVQCVAATAGKCYARELVAVAEDFNVPFTWMIGVSARDPMGNANLYRNEYLHRIPSWHEIGLLLDLNNGQSAGDRARGDLVRLGKEVLKQCHVKPTSCWVMGGGLVEGVLRAIEEAGILAVVAPDNATAEAPAGPFHPAYDAPALPGSARLCRLSRPVADLSAGPEVALEAALAASSVVLVTVRDDRDDTQRLRQTLQEAMNLGAAVQVATAAIRV